MSKENILNYFIDLEANTPPSVLVSQHNVKNNKNYNQIVSDENVSLSWDILNDMKHMVYLGIINVENVISKFNYTIDLQNKCYSYLLSFEVDQDGYPKLETMNIPQYIITMAHKNLNMDTQYGKSSEFYQVVKSDFSEWIAILKESNKRVAVEDLNKYLKQMLNFIEIFSMQDLACIAYTESVQENMSFPSESMSSFVLSDLVKVKDFYAKNKVSASASDNYFVENYNDIAKIDVSNDVRNIKTILNPMNSNFAAWMDDGCFPLVAAQQVATNLLFRDIYQKQNTNLFSVNGPPGTGKTTMIQSIVANILFLRSLEIIKLKRAGHSPFEKKITIKIDGESLDVYEPNKSLQDFEIVIASSNNSAVENITEELPLMEGMNSKLVKNFDYFKPVSDFILKEDTWGLIAASMGNKLKNKAVVTAFEDSENGLIAQIKKEAPSSSKEIIIDLNTKVKALQKLNEKFVNNSLTSNERKFFDEAFVDDSFWNSDIEKIHVSSPWNQKEINEMKGGVFIDAMRLHKNLILENKDIFIDNIKLMKHVLNGKIKDKRVIRSVWKTYFLIVPVVSTTFASMGSLFSDLENGDIGWLFVDEAGQSRIQDMVGGLWRSKIGCIIGDPLQVTPVNTTHPALNEFFKAKNRIGDDWDTLALSGQEVADRVNPFGALLKNDNSTIWVGSPLRVHRRCDNPMFDISNVIAYGGTMIHAKGSHNPKEIESILGKSAWFDVKANEMKGYWVKNQYDLFKTQLALIFENQSEYKFPSLYVISPYKDVARETINHLRKDRNEWLPKGYNFTDQEVEAWLYKSVGTIHTFQGKEADAVFIMLGGDPEKDVSWAVTDPNIINVACTRAKTVQYFIGDKNLWNCGVLKTAMPIIDGWEC